MLYDYKHTGTYMTGVRRCNSSHLSHSEGNRDLEGSSLKAVLKYLFQTLFVAWNSASAPGSWSTAKNYKHEWNLVQNQIIYVHTVPSLWASLRICLSSKILPGSERISFSGFHGRKGCMGSTYPSWAAWPTSVTLGLTCCCGFGVETMEVLKQATGGQELWEDCMRRCLLAKHVAGRQYVWVVITGFYKCFKNTSAWPAHKHHAFLSNLVVSASTLLVLHQPLYLRATKICKPCLTFQECWTNTGSLQK